MPGGCAYKSVIEALMGLGQKIRCCGTGRNNLMNLDLERDWALKSGGEV